MKRRALVAALFVAAAAAVWLVAREHLALDRLAARELELRVANRKLDHDGVFYLLTVRMLHVPYTADSRGGS